MTPFSECEFRIYARKGKGLEDPTEYEPLKFTPHCVPGDWNTQAFYPAFVNGSAGLGANSYFPQGTNPLAFFTGHRLLPMNPGEHASAVVCLPIGTTPDQTYVSARSSDCAHGRIILFGFGIVETPGKKSNHKVRLAFGTLPPKLFKPTCQNGDWVSWPSFPSPFPDAPQSRFHIAFTTATGADIGNNLHTCAPVAVVHPTGQNTVKELENGGQWQVEIKARNSDVSAGLCGMNYLLVTSSPPKTDQGLWVDTGRIEPRWFFPTGVIGDRLNPPIAVKFAGAFLEPPAVFVSPSADGVTQA